MFMQLKASGEQVGRRKARRYMNEMDIYPMYTKMNLSKRMQKDKVCPYLLQNAVIHRPNQAVLPVFSSSGGVYLTSVPD